MNKTYLSILICFFICINRTDLAAQQVEKKNVDQTNIASHISFLDKIPDNIRKLENLTILKENFEQTYAFELIPAQEFGMDNELNFSKIYKSFEDEKGNVIIWGKDSNQKSGIYVYNDDGTYKSQLGRQGTGPGEYGTILNLDVRAGKVYVSDFTSMRLNEYSTENYLFERWIDFEIWNTVNDLEFKNHIIPRNDGKFLAAYTDRILQNGQIELKYILMDSSGERQNDTMLNIPSGFAINVRNYSKPTVPLWFMGNTAITLSNRDDLYTVSSREFLVKKYDTYGQYQSAFYYPIEGPSFNLDDYLKTAGSLAPRANQIRKAFDQMEEELPQTSPFIDNMIIDDENRIWIAVIAGENYEWWILAESGELLAKLVLPKEQSIFDIKKGFLYSKDVNEEGFEYVVKYRIEISEE